MAAAGQLSPRPSEISRNSFPVSQIRSGEADLYFRRACLAAAEERYDVALVFCTKAVEVAPRHLAARLLLAQIHDRALGNLEAAVAGYRKVIALAGYDGADPHCLAAREALDALGPKDRRARRRAVSSRLTVPVSARSAAAGGDSRHGYCGGLPHTCGRYLPPSRIASGERSTRHFSSEKTASRPEASRSSEKRTPPIPVGLEASIATRLSPPLRRPVRS